jgi:HD-GYP domain-containing protein (c-di-GMP phosphodiesterase class II)
VRHHHERWDGKGYPDGLAGEAIPLGARIIAVIDAFDAMTSARPYAQPLSTADALARIEAGAGTRWDPAVVAALIECLGQLGVGERAVGEPLTLEAISKQLPVWRTRCAA